ncbi:MAG: Hsp20/alpha crystallin family protein [Deltaproteobacteria bacterium]|nr:MAG: Hsp20/alpha crystallin family protein [Deltaproteobacteria bacterium]
MSRKAGHSRARPSAPGGPEDRGPLKACGGVVLLDFSDETAYRPLSDVTEVDDAVRILLELPGVPADSVQVWVRGDRIEVTGEKPTGFPPGETSFLCLERIFGKFRRVFEVVGSVNLGEVTAIRKDGIMAITIPKIPERRGRERRIPVIEG